MRAVQRVANPRARSVDCGVVATGSAALAALATLVLLVWISRQSHPNIFIYVLVMAAGSALVPLSLCKSRHLASSHVLGVALILHVLVLIGLPTFEDDYYRFIWDGWLSLTQGTPYGTPPAAFYGSSQVQPALRSVLDGVNNPEVPTIYGPVLQALFALTHFFAGTDSMGLRLLFSAANLVLIAVLVKRLPAGRVALYAWNPFVISEIGFHIHPDGLLGASLMGGIILMRRHPVASGLLFAVAAGIKLVALAAWPLLLRTRPRATVAAIIGLAVFYSFFAWRGGGVGLDATAIFAREWYFNPFAYDLLRVLLSPELARIAAATLACAGIVWLHARGERHADGNLAGIFGLILLFAPAVNAWYLLWLLPFAIGGRQVWPFAACVALPFSYLTGINLGDDSMEPFAVHGLARAAQMAILAAAVLWDIGQARRRHLRPAAIHPLRSIPNPGTAIVIPALNEERAVGQVVTSLLQAGIQGLTTVVVVDNGSSDRTAERARAAGALVVTEPRRGYGQACLTGLRYLPADTDVVLFADADGSDLAVDAALLVDEVIKGRADLALGSRMLGLVEPGAMTWPQRFGNWLASTLIWMIWGTRYTDLGPLRAIRRDCLEKLAMQDRNFGWTVEMQVRAARLRLRTIELPAGYRCRVGTSKISGTLSGVLKAGTKILYVVAREAFAGPPLGQSSQWRGSLAPDRSQSPCVA